MSNAQMEARPIDAEAEITNIDTARMQRAFQAQHAQNVDPFLSVAEAANYISMSLSFVYRHSENGDIPSFKMGRKTKFRKSDLDKWAVANTNTNQGDK